MGGPSITISIVLSILCTAAICVIFMPEKYGRENTGFGVWVHRVINFKKLLLETILKVLYTLCTVFSLILGLFLLFGKNTFAIGLLLMFVGPILLRIVFESSMMFILLVTNVIAIRNKLAPTGENASKPAQAVCPYCGQPLDPGTRFCQSCGQAVNTP